MGNIYLEKIAQDLTFQQKFGLTELGVGGVGAGAFLAHNQYQRGHLTGRESFYHGTSPTRADGIRAEGLHPGKHVGSTALVEAMNGHAPGALGSSSHVFMAKDKFNANQYVDHALISENDGLEALAAHVRKPGNVRYDGLKKNMLLRQFGIGDSAKGFAEANIPMWKHPELKVVDNPEAALLKNDSLTKALHGLTDEGIEKELNTNVLTVEGHIPGKHSIGNKDYQKNSLKEIGEYLKANPKRFLTHGVGKTALGAGLVIGSPLAALKMKHIIENQKV